MAFRRRPGKSSPSSSPDRTNTNAFVRNVRKVYHPLGFKKGYNFVLFFIFGGAMLGFIFARIAYLNIDGVFCAFPPKNNLAAAPGECYYYRRGFKRVGIILHLACILRELSCPNAVHLLP